MALPDHAVSSFCSLSSLHSLGLGQATPACRDSLSLLGLNKQGLWDLMDLCIKTVMLLPQFLHCVKKWG
jgi:hypothetical protein